MIFILVSVVFLIIIIINLIIANIGNSVKLVFSCLAGTTVAAFCMV